MITRRTASRLGELFAGYFYKTTRSGIGRDTKTSSSVDYTELYDFLFERDYDAFFCNKAREIVGETRKLKDFVMKLHTGETLVANTKDWTWVQREKLGQRFLKDLCEDIFTYWENGASSYRTNNLKDKYGELKSSLELDGYQWKSGKLLTSEADVLDVAEESGVLQSLYKELNLSNPDTAFHHLKLSEEHYLASRWDDCISNSRKFFECVLQESASAHSSRILNTPLSENTFSRPVEVRKYLERENLLDTKEVTAVQALYGLLSHTGGHPYMAESDQARLLRQLALTFSQFVMLRLRGRLTTPSTP